VAKTSRPPGFSSLAGRRQQIALLRRQHRHILGALEMRHVGVAADGAGGGAGGVQQDGVEQRASGFQPMTSRVHQIRA
jgi:limonene-1,2-epoxide hydrolase